MLLRHEDRLERGVQAVNYGPKLPKAVIFRSQVVVGEVQVFRDGLETIPRYLLPEN